MEDDPDNTGPSAPESLMPYDTWTEQAMRRVAVQAIKHVAQNGLPGEHHFYLTFRTDDPGTVLPPRLRAQYPQEMTIVLQHQFWDLEVSEEAFEVGLSFGGVPERLRVPFDAINGFFDPSVEFGLQFSTMVEEDNDDAAESSEAETTQIRPQPRKPEAVKPEAVNPEPAKLGRKSPPKPLAAVPPPADKDPDDGGDQPSGGAEVVSLDRFRQH